MVCLKDTDIFAVMIALVASCIGMGAMIHGYVVMYKKLQTEIEKNK